MRHTQRWWWVIPLLGSLELAMAQQRIPGEITEGSTSWIRGDFLDKGNVPIVPESVSWWVSALGTNVRLSTEYTCPTNCVGWPADTIDFELDSATNRMLGKAETEEHRISIRFSYPDNCVLPGVPTAGPTTPTPVPCAWGVDEGIFTVRNANVVVNPTPPGGPTAAATPTGPPTRTPTRTPH